MFVFKSLNEFRKYELTLSWNGTGYEMGNQIFIAHKNARLLRVFADIYRYNCIDYITFQEIIKITHALSILWL